MGHSGGCHCGNIRVSVRLTSAPDATPLRACTCSFCRAHHAVMTSDPRGGLELRAQDWMHVQYYRFGTGTADFVICRRCGVFVAALGEGATGRLAVVNVNALDDRAAFTRPPEPMVFEGESKDARLDRRAGKWMPASVHR